jgi:hypothetical protein
MRDSAGEHFHQPCVGLFVALEMIDPFGQELRKGSTEAQRKGGAAKLSNRITIMIESAYQLAAPCGAKNSGAECVVR